MGQMAVAMQASQIVKIVLVFCFWLQQNFESEVKLTSVFGGFFHIAFTPCLMCARAKVVV